MIYSSSAFALIITGLLMGRGDSLITPASGSVGFRRATLAPRAVPEWLTKPEGAGGENFNGDGAEGDGLITVRFINTVNQKDVVCRVEAGSNLLFIGDANGVKLPRACRTGLCGSCTCEVKDGDAIKTDTNPRDGWATIRACSTKCFVPPGEEEMIIDVYRMQNKVVSPTGTLVANPVGAAGFQDPMSRFSGNWEKEFRPSWDAAKPSVKGMGQVGGASNPLNKAKLCTQCSGTGRCVCYTCNGLGRVIFAEGKDSTGNAKMRQCSLCVGLKNIGCGNCRGTGTISIKKKAPSIA